MSCGNDGGDAVLLSFPLVLQVLQNYYDSIAVVSCSLTV